MRGASPEQDRDGAAGPCSEQGPTQCVPHTAGGEAVGAWGSEAQPTGTLASAWKMSRPVTCNGFPNSPYAVLVGLQAPEPDLKGLVWGMRLTTQKAPHHSGLYDKIL